MYSFTDNTHFAGDNIVKLLPTHTHPTEKHLPIEDLAFIFYFSAVTGHFKCKYLNLLLHK